MAQHDRRPDSQQPTNHTQLIQQHSASNILILGGFSADSIQSQLERWHTDNGIQLRYLGWGPNPVHTITTTDWTSCQLLCLAGPLDQHYCEALLRCLSLHEHEIKLLIHGADLDELPIEITQLVHYHSPHRLTLSTLLDLISVFVNKPVAASHPFDTEQQRQAQRLAERVNNADDWFQALASVQVMLQSILQPGECDIVLWSDQDDRAAFSESILFSEHNSGLSAFVRSTGESINVQPAGQDARYNANTDIPASISKLNTISQRQASANETEQGAVLILPLLKQTHGPGVIRCYRSAEQGAFKPAREQLLHSFLDAISDALQRQWLLHAKPAETRLGTESPILSNPIYRREAIQQLIQGDSDESGVLIQDDQLGRWTYWILLVGILSLAAYLWLGSVHEYATGPAVISASGHTELTALSNGTVSQLLVNPGQTVQQGDALIRLYQGRELAELQGLQQEFDARLRQRLLNPEDVQIEAVLINLRSELDLARSRLAERTINAPRAGKVGDIRVRQGQYVVSGQSLMNLTHGSENRELIALIPGRYRPQLQQDMSLRMELSGYPYDYQHLTITSIDAQVTGPQQARLYLGTAIGDALTIEGPVVLVHATLPATFTTRTGAEYSYHEGMSGRVEIRLRSEPIIERLMPGIKLLRGQHE